MISSSSGDLRHTNRTWTFNDFVQSWRLISHQPYLNVQWFLPVLATYITQPVLKQWFRPVLATYVTPTVLNDFVQFWRLTSHQPYLNVQWFRPVLATYVTPTVLERAMISSSPGDLRHTNRTWTCNYFVQSWWLTSHQPYLKNDFVQFWRLTSHQPYLNVRWFLPVLATYITQTVLKQWFRPVLATYVTPTVPER